MLFMFFLRFVIGPCDLRLQPGLSCFPALQTVYLFLYAELSIAPLTFTFVLIGRSNNLWACFRTLFEYVL